MNIRSFAKSLRHAAEVLEQLLEGPGTPEIAEAILRASPKPKKKHWTQLPKNKAKLRKMLRKAHMVRNGHTE